MCRVYSFALVEEHNEYICTGKTLKGWTAMDEKFGCICPFNTIVISEKSMVVHQLLVPGRVNPRTAGGLSHLRTAGGGGGAHRCPPPG